MEGDRDLRAAVIAARHSVKTAVLKAHFEIMRVMLNEFDRNRAALVQLGLVSTVVREEDPLLMGWTFRRFHGHYRKKHMDTGLDSDEHETFNALNNVLRNNLVLDQGLNIVGEDDLIQEKPTSPSCFLCATLADKDLPWGNETDW